MSRTNLLAILLGALLLACAGCVPSRFVIDLTPYPERLRPHVVAVDPGAGRHGPKVAVIHVQGLIADASLPAVVGSNPNPVDELVRRLKAAEDDASIVGVVLRINSPGGTVMGSETMYHEVRRFKEATGKPVVASLGEVAASGGYYLALAADEIVAMPTTTTASIGVILQTVNVSGALSKIGVEARSVTSGPNKAMGSPLEPAQERHFELMQGMVDEFYAGFRGLVAARRPAIEGDELDRVTDGRVVTGAEAERVGLVDSLGGLHEAFESVKRLADVPAASMVVFRPGRRSHASAYVARSTQTPALSLSADVHVLGMPAGGLQSLPPGFYFLWAPGVN